MTAYPIPNPFPLFVGLTGLPLTGAKIYIGVAGQDPETNPIAVYQDSALTIPYTQPLRTNGGYLVGVGTPANAYPITTPYSIRVRTSANVEVFYLATVRDPITDLLAQLAGPTGSSLVGYIQGGTGAVPRTVQAAVRQLRVSLSDFGAVGDNSTDDRPAFIKARDYLISQAYSPSTFYQGAQRLYIPGGTGYFSDTIDLTDATFIIEGDGSGQQGGVSSRMRFAQGKGGFRTQTYATAGLGIRSPVGKGADATIIRNLSILGAAVASDVNAPGILMRARATLEDLEVYGFAGDGVLIRAEQGGGGAVEGNANGWMINRVTLNANKLSGLHTLGKDANAGISIGIDTNANGRYGIEEQSFLGNIHLGFQIDANTLGAINNPTVAGRSLFMGYTETGQISHLGPQDIAFGSFYGGTTGGSYAVSNDLDGGGFGSSSGFYTTRTNSTDSTMVVNSTIGTDPANLFYESIKRSTTSGVSFADTWLRTLGLGVLNFAPNTFATPYIALVNANAARNYGRAAPVDAACEIPVLMVGSGGGANCRNIDFADSIPTSGTGGPGDIKYNRAPVVGQPKGWQRTVAGPWVSMGNL